MSNSANLASSSNPPVMQMNRRFLKACSKGDRTFFNLIDASPDILLSTTPHENNCLHIAAMLGHHEVAMAALSRAPSLLSGTNVNGETPLIAALMAANGSLATDIFTAALDLLHSDDLEIGRMPFYSMLLKVDRHRENALHHAIRNGFEDLALYLLEQEPKLSEQVSGTPESPMYMAARRGYSRVVRLLLEIPDSEDCGPEHGSALNAAVRFNHTDIVRQLLQRRPTLAYNQKENGNTPLLGAVILNRLQMVEMFLEHDPNLGYINNATTNDTPFIVAARTGNVMIAKMIMSTCPDSVYTSNGNGNNALLEAIRHEQWDFINYILKTPQLHRLINQVTNDGSLPLHFAARKCDPKLLRSLLSHSHDYTAVNSNGEDAVDMVYHKITSWKTLKWNESFTLLSNAIPFGVKLITEEAKHQMKNQAIEEVKSLTEKYISKTSFVAALLATITFAAAFTLPGGLKQDTMDAGHPIFSRKFSFQMFLIFDTIAMCSSLSVTFLCILATWEDLDFLLNYRKTTRWLMWCAYVATALAFGIGVFTVIEPDVKWLGYFILALCIILPFLSKIIGDWPLLIVRLRLRGLFRKDLLPNI